MPDLVVTPRWDHYAVRELMDINHGASLDNGGNIYVWCFGPTSESLWMRADEGAAVSCFRCLVYGPREDWHRRNPYGQRGREECFEGQRYLVFDTETNG